MRKSSKVLLAAATASLLALTGCAAPGGGDGDAAPGGANVDQGPLNLALSTDPGSLNPITNATHDAVQLAYLAYESLMYFEAGKEPAGWIADEWTESATELSFTLKSGVTCSDGAELTASDVKATFDYASDDENGSPFKGVYFPASGLTITANDDAREVTFVSEQPQSFLLQNIGYLPIVCASGISDPSILETQTAGTGMYQLASAAAGDSYDYQLRSDYTWGPSGVTSETEGLPESIHAQVVSSASTQTNMLLSGELDLAEIGGQDRDRLESGDFATLDIPDRPGQLFFNQAEGRATHDLKVRTAIASAIDREEVAMVATGNRGTVKSNMVSSLSSVCLGADSASAIPGFDLSKAESLLDDAGWIVGTDGIRAKDGKKFEIKIVYPADEGSGVTSAVELLQQQLAAVGITATPAPASSYTDVIFQGGDWDLVWAPISVSLPSIWAGILSGEFPPDGGNWTFNTNQEYFDLAATASSYAGEESCEYWMAAQDSLFNNLEVLPISESTSTFYGAGVEFEVSTNGIVMVPSLRMANS